MWWIFAILIGLVISIIVQALTPKPQRPPPPAVQDLADPTAEAGRELPVLFGLLTIKGTNILWWGDKAAVQYEVAI